MPRRRSHRLTSGIAAAGVGAAMLAAAGCQAGATDNGCQVTRQLVLPGTTLLPLLDQVRIDRVPGAGYVVLGADDSAVRWTAVDGAGAVGVEQSFALPAGTVRAFYGLAGAETPGDRVIVGVLATAANGSDAELRFVAAPADGSPAPAPGPAVVTFGDGVTAVPLIAMGTSATGMYAGAAWIDPETGLPTYVFVDGQGAVVGGEPAAIETALAPGYSCLGFSPGKQELTVTYQRAPLDPSAAPTWLIADIAVGGGVETLELTVVQPSRAMSCARTVLYDTMTPGASPEYAIAWQDTSGSWLSMYYGGGTRPQSFPFASSTDFGGPDLQPPLAGLATFGNDFGVLFARPHTVELWRIDRAGNRRSGSLPFPSLQGHVGGVSSVASANLLTSTYVDLTGEGIGRRLVVESVCH